MPIYEYECPNCGASFEELVRSREQKIICPRCQNETPKKKMSAAAFRCGAGLSAPASATSASSGCGGCTATSCAGCK